MKNKREVARLKRHRRIRLKMCGNKERPRLVISRSLKHLSAQAIDDTEKKTLFSLSTMDKEIKGKTASGGNIKAAEAFGEIFAKKLKDKGFSKIIFDRAGHMYHGRIKAFAESLRKGGLEF